jgi:hypothetical protein
LLLASGAAAASWPVSLQCLAIAIPVFNFALVNVHLVDSVAIGVAVRVLDVGVGVIVLAGAGAVVVVGEEDGVGLIEWRALDIKISGEQRDN